MISQRPVLTFGFMLVGLPIWTNVKCYESVILVLRNPCALLPYILNFFSLLDTHLTCFIKL